MGYKQDSIVDAMKRKSKRLSTNLPPVKKNTELSKHPAAQDLSQSSRNNGLKVSLANDNNETYLAAKMGSQEFKTGAFKNQLNNEQHFNPETIAKDRAIPKPDNIAEIIIEERDPQEETTTVDQTAQFEMQKRSTD